MKTKTYWVKNSTLKNLKSPEMTVGSFLVENVSNEVFAVIEAEKVWKSEGYSFHPEMSVARETADSLPLF
jgi:hypothetical protein